MRISALVASLAALLLVTASAEANVPAATTGGASQITQTTAHLTGSVKPNGQDTTWHFEIGPTTAYGSSTPEQGPIKAGAGTTSVAADVGALQPGTTYHFRLVATNASGSIPGKDKTFTTRPAVSIVAAPSTVLWGRSATITGQVFGGSVSGVTVTLQEDPYPFAGFTDVATTTTNPAGQYQFIRAVLANTAYRVVAETKPPGTSSTAFVYEQDMATLKANTYRPRRGKSVLFTGTATPARVGTTVLIQRLGSRGWGTVLRAKLSATPNPLVASFAVRLRRVVSGSYRAVIPTGWDHVTGFSPTRHIRVRP